MEDIKEKTADKMFEELGYEILFKDEKIIQYEFEGFYMYTEIKFDLKGKTVLKEYTTGESHEITLEELKAINKKVEELRLVESWCRYELFINIYSWIIYRYVNYLYSSCWKG